MWKPTIHDLDVWRREGFPGDSGACAKAQCDSIGPTYTQEECNVCAHWEMSNGLSPWDNHRFCNSNEPGNPWHYPVGEFWRVTKTEATVQQGVPSGPGMLNLDAASTAVSAAFHFDGVTEAAPTRQLSGIFSGASIQAE